jgi:hypothetical protein
MSLEKAIKELYRWQTEERSTSFHSQLYGLFQKADTVNLARLTKGFPDEALAVRLWKDAPNEAAFFKMYGYGINKPKGSENGK